MTIVAQTTSLGSDRGTCDHSVVNNAKATADATPGLRVGRLGAVLPALSALIWIPQAALIAFSVSNIMAGESASSAFLPAAGILTLGIMRAWMERASTRMNFEDARAQLTRLRAQTLARVQEQSPLDQHRASSGTIASSLTEQAESIVPYLARFQPARMKATLAPVVIIACVLPFAWVPALIMMIAAPLIPLFMALIGWRAKEASERHLVEMGAMNGFLLDRLRSLATIRSFDAVDSVARQLRADAESLRRRTMAVLRIAFLSSAVLELFAALGVAMVAVFIGFHLLGNLEFGAWGSKLAPGPALFILLLAPAFFEPLRELSAVWHDRAAGEAAIRSLQDSAKADETICGDTTSNEAEGIHAAPAVNIRNLAYRYTGADADVLRGLNLTIAPGERVAIMAPSGAGKSTLLALIAGLASPNDGTIAIGNLRMNEANGALIRSQTAWVGQSPHIFSRSLKGNICLYRDLSDDQLSKAISMARLDRLSELRGHATVGEDGAGISGGETLRVAIARAAALPSISLILADEPTAHLDRTTSDQITAALLQLAEGRTLIIATHDETLARQMDRIICLDVNGSEVAA